MQFRSSVRIALFALWAGAVGACGTLTSSPDGKSVGVAANQEFQLAPGQTAVLSGSDLSVRFDSLTGDSRCPVGVLCIWAGDVNVHLTVIRGKKTPSREVLHITNEPHSAVDGSETIELTGVAPLMRQQQPIQPSEYRVSLIIRTK